MYKPTTKIPEDKLAKMIEERVSPLGNKLNEISEKLTKKNKEPDEEKIEDIIRKIKNKQSEKIIEEKKLKEIHNDVDCPTCESHVHKMVGNDLILKCTGDNCGEEFAMLSKSATHSCRNCGFPLKKPAEGKGIKDCPLCGSNKGADPIEDNITHLNFDFSKTKK